MSTQRMKPSGMWWAVCALLVGVASPAAAEPAPPEAEQARAAALFSESADHYRAGRFEKAIELLLEAHRLAGEPVLLYNLGRAYEGNGDLEEAIRAYERYLAESKEVKDRGAIERRIATLKAQLEQRRRLERDAAAAKKRAADAEADKPAPTASPFPWIIAGVGGATLIAGAVLGGVSASRAGDAEAEPLQIPAADLRDEAETFATAANVTLAVGGVILAGGLAWGIADVVLLPSSATASSLRLRLGLGHADLAFAFD